MNEYVIWGSVNNTGEQILLTQFEGEHITCPLLARRLADKCRTLGADNIRIQTINLADNNLNFDRTINNV